MENHEQIWEICKMYEDGSAAADSAAATAAGAAGMTNSQLLRIRLYVEATKGDARARAILIRYLRDEMAQTSAPTEEPAG